MREARPFKDKARPLETFELGMLESCMCFNVRYHVYYGMQKHHAIVAGLFSSQQPLLGEST